MQKLAAIVGSVVFFFLAPGTVGGFVPWWITGWQTRPAFFGIDALYVVGAVLVAFGSVVIVESFARFATKGLGTPAPVHPPKHLVVTGFYRWVRNPMYVGVLSAVFGQALVFADIRLLYYGAALWLGFHLFVVLYEEPTLKRTFGAQYADFAGNVPRWIPRLRPWRPKA